jgi:hypothetical protein
MAEQEHGSGFGSSSARVGGIAVLLVLAIVAARARASGAMPHVAGPPGALVLGLIRSIGIGVLTAGVLLLVWGRRMKLVRVVGAGEEKKKLTAAQRKRVWAAALVGVIVALVYQIVLQLLGPSGTRKQANNQDNPDAPIPDGHGWIDPMAGHHQPGEAGIGTYLTVLAVLLALVALIIILVRRTDTVELDDEQDEDEEAEAVASAMVAGRAAVQDRSILDSRQAIVACFAAMERALAGVGGEVAPRAADTPEEVLRRGIAGARLPEEPAGTLLALFREARFSTHPMGEPDRAAADRALGAMLTALGVTEERAR